MAQQDTGLGWSAEDAWLMQTSAQVAEIQSISGGYTLNTIPNATYVDIMSESDWIMYRPAQGYRDGVKAVSTNGLVFAFIHQDSYGIWTPYFISRIQSAKVRWAWNTSSTYSEISTFSQWSQRSGWYYADTGSGITSATARETALPIYTGNMSDAINAAIDAITISSDAITKTNPGYTVACLAKWKTANGTELISPILISSDSSFTEMSGASGYNFAQFNKLLSGVRFYMGFWDIPATATVTSLTYNVDLTSLGNIDLERLFMTLVSTSYSHIIIINSPDPYEEEGGESGEEGGDGEDLEDDEMGISHHAIPAAINTGFCRIYCPSEQQLRDLSNFLWSAQFDITAVKKLFANPMDSVLGLSAVPLTLSGANSPVYLGGVDTEMSFPMVSYQSYQVPMGAITVEKRWGSYLDYDPYTKFSIFLPFIGFKDLSADDIMGKQIILDYDVDILSGACTARLQAGGNVLYQWSGQCSIQLPVTASNWNQVFQSATSAALSAGLAVATGSAGPVLAGALAAEGAQAIMGKPRIERGGTASGAAGWMGGLTPYLVRVTPEAIIPADQNKFIGYPAFSSISLGALSGYNEISSIHLEGIPATGAELDELEAILKGGVIF